jgi:hypothetical protein
LEDEEDVRLLRFIKHEQSDVKDLVRRISAAAGIGSRLLEDFARADPSVRLDQIGLPPGETATREAIASTKQKELLGQTGDAFELSLLLTQTEALGYASHLARVAGEMEPDRDRARALAALAGVMERLNREVVALLLSKMSSSTTNAGGRARR